MMDNLENKNISPEKPVICTEHKGLVNKFNNCFRNVIFQSLFMTPEFKNLLYKCNVNSTDSKTTIVKIKQLFLKLQDQSNEKVEWKSIGRSKQGDAQEFFVHILKSLMDDLNNMNHHNFINELFQGKITDNVKCNECKTVKFREDTVLDISIPIRRPGSTKPYANLTDALKGFTDSEILTGDNQYFCECCKRKCNAEKILKFSELPYIMAIHLKRFEFDFKTMSYIKLYDKIQFSLDLNVNSFKPKESDANNSKVNKAESSQYHLYIIIIHMGNYNGGHYYVLIKDFKTNQWLRFNDESVTVVSMEHIIKMSNGDRTKDKGVNVEIPYILMYRKTDNNKNEHAMPYNEFPPHLNEFHKLLKLEEEKNLKKRNNRKRKL